MKKLAVVAIVFCLAWVHAVSTGRCAEISSGDVASKPDVFMRVVQEPNPLLLGHWGCTHTTTVAKTNEKYQEPIEYWLLKVDGKYAVYFYRFKQGKEKRYRGWREWYLKGDEISAPPQISIFVKGSDVYYQWKDDPPTRMTRIE
ncbi:MAG: hypothetical protein AB9873_15295 [Syntrophobacteraceae bacterium]